MNGEEQEVSLTEEEHVPNAKPEAPNPKYKGSSLIRNSSPPQDHHRALGIFLL